MNPIDLRGVILGAGRPKIAVSLTGSTLPTLLSEAETLRTLPVDIAEWRLDCFSAVSEPEEVLSALSSLRAALGDMPLLATFRSRSEGGCAALDAEGYLALNQSLIASGQVDLLDVELFSDGGAAPLLVGMAHAAGLPVLLSSHNFQKTPSEEEVLALLSAMDAFGADVLKVAVMPQNRRDVLTLLSATAAASERFEQPLVTISMGPLGAVSRLSGEVFGSAMTFASAGHCSAPGQLPADALSEILGLLSTAPV